MAISIAGKTGEVIAKLFMNRLLSMFGPPEDVLTNQGSKLR